ncbi:MAG TPA: hypothetical protein PLH92_06050 [Mycobacterium sp.]|mgnify:CR=1 FL=1|uniref:hypothetical protein n=1 Tax=Mycolicibacterium sp. TaxID=2320850 RepID=UPI0025F94804|nr:hypothetical protein [Mycolicibacterium sp.]HPX36885.1 hypothetical protein [Mycobacterium sp.]HQC76265.1 hypothetical protein [Mycobacterium sp.]
MRRNLVAALIAGSALLSVGPAGMSAADDTVPPAPLPAEAAAPPQRIIPPDIVPALGNVLAQSGSEKAGLFGLPDISAHGGDLLLAQNTAPAAPGGGQVAGIYPLDAFQSNYLLPQYETPAVLGQGTPAPGIGPDADIPGTGRIAFLRRLHEMYAAGDLKGSLLGQMPASAWDPPAEEAAATAPVTAAPVTAAPVTNVPNP